MEKLLSNLQFQKFKYSFFPELNDKPYEEYKREQLEKNKICPGTVLKLKNGSTVLVGDCNKNLSSNGDSDFDYSDIVEYAYIYG
jgi:hypothetical protein